MSRTKGQVGAASPHASKHLSKHLSKHVSRHDKAGKAACRFHLAQDATECG